MKVRTAVFATHGHAPFPPTQLFTCGIEDCPYTLHPRAYDWIRGTTTEGFIDVPLCKPHLILLTSTHSRFTATIQAAARSRGLPR